MLSSPCRRRDWYVHVEQQFEASGVRKKRREMRSALARRARYQRHLLAIEPRLANQQARGHGHAHPSVFQNIDREAGASGSQIAGHVQVIIDARQRGVQGRRFGIVLDRVGFRPQHAVFVDRNHDPSRDVGRFKRLVLELRLPRPNKGKRPRCRGKTVSERIV